MDKQIPEMKGKEAPTTLRAIDQVNADPVASIDHWSKNTTFFNMDGHQIEVTKPGGPMFSALFYCRTCRSGFHRAAVRGQYTNPHHCPHLELIWNELRPAWRRWLDLRVDRYTLLRQALKRKLRSLFHGSP